jgi:hypothetical protein
VICIGDDPFFDSMQRCDWLRKLLDPGYTPIIFSTIQVPKFVFEGDHQIGDGGIYQRTLKGRSTQGARIEALRIRPVQGHNKGR